MTIETLDKIAELLANATPGEIKVGTRQDESIWMSIGDPKRGPFYQGDLVASEFDAALIATLRNNSSDLLAMAREALESRKVIEDAPHSRRCSMVDSCIGADEEPCLWINSTLKMVCIKHRFGIPFCNCWKSKRPTRGAGEREKT